MMNRKQFENKLANKFDDFSPKYEANSKMWDTISSELSKKRKRRKAILLPLFFFGLLGLFVWQSSVVDKNNTSDSPITDLNASLPSVIQDNQDSIAKKDMLSESSINETRLIFSNKAIEQSLGQVAQRGNEKASSSISRKSARTTENYIVLFDLPESRPSQTATLNTSMENSSDAIVSRGHLEAHGSTVKQIPLLPLQNIYLGNEDIDKDRLNTLLLSDLQIGASSITIATQAQSRFSAGLTFGINSLNSSYNLNDQSFASVLEERINSESTDLQYFAGFQVEYDLSPKWSIQSGVNFYHFQDESFNVSVETQIDTLENFQQTPPGMDTSIVGTAFITNTSIAESRIYTNRQLLSIPIVLVYNTALSQKSSLGIGLGLEKTIFSNINGIEEDLDGNVYDLSLDNESRYGNRGLYGLVRLLYIYELTSKWDLRLESNLKYELLNNYNTSAPIEKSFHAVGIGISTQLKF